MMTMTATTTAAAATTTSSALLLLILIGSVLSLQQPILQQIHRQQRRPSNHSKVMGGIDRRGFLWKSVAAATTTTTTAAAGGMVTAAVVTVDPAVAAATDSSPTLNDIVQQLQAALGQLDKVPALIEKEKWDSVRAVLITPPIADCWAKTNKPILQKYAQLLEEMGGDEFEALEKKEDLVSHLRYLDMAVYNNNFNPITVEGKTGASPSLIKSYYEDPINEYTQSRKALESLLELSKGL
jgi:hypothetical protein